MKIVTTCCLLFLSLLSVGQADFNRIEEEIVKTYTILKEAYRAGEPERQVIFAKKMQQQLLFALLQRGSYYYPFAKLGWYINIVESADQQIRVFSWDALQGGAWRRMVSMVQFRGAQNETYVHVLSDGNEEELDNYAAVCIEQVHVLEELDKRYYVLIGRGQQGEGQQHQTIQVVSLGHNALEKCTTCFERNQENWVLKSSLDNPIQVHYNQSSRKLTYALTVFNETTGRDIQQKVRMIWRNGRFFTW